MNRLDPLPHVRRRLPPRLPRALVLSAALLLGALLASATVRAADASSPTTQRIPVIFDTDIGDDIDDTWALGLLLRCPELDLRLVVGDHGKTLYRARLLAKLLEVAGRTDVPVGLGLDVNAHGDGPQADWVKDYDLNRYPGRVYPDGVRAMIRTLMEAPEPMTLIAVGPMPNLAAALKLEPRIAQKTRFVGMHGSVRVGYGGKSSPDAEYNVRADAKACQQVFTAPWASATITPLDTCGLVQLKDDRYRRLLDAEGSNPLVRAILENYRLWSRPAGSPTPSPASTRQSSILFDTVAVYLAVEENLTTMENVQLRVTDDGFTRVDPAARTIRVASQWKDLGGFEAWLVQRLTAP